MRSRTAGSRRWKFSSPMAVTAASSASNAAATSTGAVIEHMYCLSA
ncbi:hypothetical protein [Mycobacterium decipiens]|nr:hypothetical protein [Mycobacterium decipiens]